MGSTMNVCAHKNLNLFVARMAEPIQICAMQIAMELLLIVLEIVLVSQIAHAQSNMHQFAQLMAKPMEMHAKPTARVAHR